MPIYPLRLSVTNPSFENGTAPGTGWVTVNGTPGFGTANPPPDLRGGNRYLIVSTSGGTGTYRVRQDVPLPAECWADIDAGLLSVTIRGLWANTAAGNDVGFVELAFLDGAGAVLATSASGAFPDSVQSWSAFGFTAAIPAGTRTLRLILGGTWVSGSAVDSYFDAIEAELILTATPAADLVQVYAERLGETPSIGRVAQVYTEALVAEGAAAGISQTYSELIRSIADRPISATGGTVVCIITG